MPVMPVRDTQRPARRKLMKQGNSLTVAVPSVFLRNLNLLPGDELLLTFDHEWGGFFVRPETPREFHSIDPSRARAIAEAVKP